MGHIGFRGGVTGRNLLLSGMGSIGSGRRADGFFTDYGGFFVGLTSLGASEGDDSSDVGTFVAG